MKTAFATLFCFTSCILQAQYTANTVYFGTVGVDFNGYEPYVLTNSGMEARESAASICDSLGHILFYTNGGTSPTVPGVSGGIWNKEHVLMDNGILADSSGCISSHYGAVIVPFPVGPNKSNEGLFYVFTRDCVESSFSSPFYNSGLTYAVVDINQNGGLGKVIEKNVVVLPFQGPSGVSTAHEPVAAVLHGNNNDYWLFSYNKDSLWRMRVTSSGIADMYPCIHAPVTAGGKITISPSRDYLVANMALYGFEAVSGNMTHIIDLPTYNCAFSSDGSRMYSMEGNVLYQYTLSAQDIFASKTLVATFSEGYTIALAPDSRIYMMSTLNAASFAGRINCPNNTVPDCGLEMVSISFWGAHGGSAFTNIMAHMLYQSGVSCTMGVQDMISDEIRVYPNPSVGELHIELIESRFAYTLCDMNGRNVAQGVSDETELVLITSALESGCYLLNVTTEHSTYQERVIIR